MIDHDFLILLHYLFHCKDDDDPLPEIGPTGIDDDKRVHCGTVGVVAVAALALACSCACIRRAFDGKWSADFAPLDSSYFPSLLLLIRQYLLNFRESKCVLADERAQRPDVGKNKIFVYWDSMGNGM